MNEEASSPGAPAALPPAAARRLADRLRRQLRELDVAYSIEPGDAARLEWRLEPEPILLDAPTWAALAAAVVQRARVLNGLLADLYASQEILRQRLLPPELVYGDPFFRRPCVNLEPARASLATVLRCDLVRTVGGRWVFTDTLANTPIGLSYAVHNRRLLAQERGDLYAQLPEFRSVINFPLRLLERLRALSPRVTDQPNIVVLTPGPQDSAYFEHSFLARKMGLPLAQGGDLLVLDDGVYFKTVAGLVPVDVIYRRLNDAHIDPVVFPTSRLSGVPGLVASIRARRVAVANAIGTGVADNRALEAYLPRLARYFLGEKLLLPGVETYYCGDVDQLAVVADDEAGELALLPAQPAARDAPAYHPGGSPVARKRALAALRAAPHLYVARRWPQPDHAASTLGDRTHRTTHLSCFAVCDGRHVEVMPGGMVRLLPARRGNEPPMWQIGTTADLVVLASHDEAPPEASAVLPERVRPLILGSRAADSLFWAGRYAERGEATARILSVMNDVSLEEISRRERKAWFPVWRGLLEATGHGAAARRGAPAWFTSDLAWHMTLEAANPSSVLSSVRATRDNLLSSRDIFSPETWGVLSRLHEALEQDVAHGGRRRGARAEAAETAIARVLDGLAAFFGMVDRTMLHDIGWHFFQTGMHLERAIMTATSLQHVIREMERAARDNRREEADLSALVRMLSSQDAYRRTYQARTEPLFVTELFLLNRLAPKSVHACLLAVERGLAAISQLTGSEDDQPLRDVRAILARFDHLTLERFFRQRTDSPRFEQPEATPLPAENGAGSTAARKEAEFPDTLAGWLLDLLGWLHGLASALHDFYLSHQARLVTAGRRPD